MFDYLSLPLFVATTALPTEPWTVNIIAHKTNKRHDTDLELIQTRMLKRVVLNYA